MTISTARSQQTVPHPVYNINPVDQRYLRYFWVQNAFDSAVVGYTIGELALRSETGWNRIFWQPMYDDIVLTGSPGQGSDMALAVVLKSATFVYGNEDSLRFYRMAYVSSYGCDPEKGPHQGGNGNGSGPNGSWTVDDWWTTVTGSIKDRSVFVLEAVDTLTGQAVTFDSVLVDSNASGPVVGRSGTDIHGCFHQRYVTGLASGRPYYFRIRPKRFGTTPVGMSARQLGSWINLSYLFSRSDTSIFRIPMWEKDVLSDIYDSLALAYVDSVYQMTGRVPPTWDMPVARDVHDTILRRYFDTVSTDGSTIYIVEKQLPNLKVYSTTDSYQPLAMDGMMSSWVVAVSPNPVTTIASLSVVGVRQPHNVHVSIFDATGQRVYDSTFHLTIGATSHDIDVAALARGLYHVIIRDRNGVAVRSVSFVRE